MKQHISTILLLLFMLTACSLEQANNPSSGSSSRGEVGRVTRVIDGDTIEVETNGETVRVRYIGINTPERDEACYQEASQANRDLVLGQTVQLEKDTSNTDRFGRLLRYIYVGDLFVNEQLLREGYAEAVRYPPDVSKFEAFRSLEQEATRNNRNCHVTGIFNDGTFAR